MTKIKTGTQLLKEACKQKRLHKKSGYDFNQPLDDFIRYCYAYKSAQSYGPAIENRYRLNLNLPKVDAQLEAGDTIENQKNKEVKASISDCGKFNAVQIRPHHNVQSYVFPWFDIDEEGNVEEYLFDIPSKVVYGLKLSSAHGLKEDVHSSKEYRITITKGDKNWQKILPYRVKGKKW
jgi:hypothetical protein